MWFVLKNNKNDHITKVTTVTSVNNMSSYKKNLLFTYMHAH